MIYNRVCAKWFAVPAIVYLLIFLLPYYASSSEPAGYILTVSWSPEWCRVNTDKNTEQCNSGKTFSIHGLWPQSGSKQYLVHCTSPERPPDKEILEKYKTSHASSELMKYQWNKHGKCSGLSAESYFKKADSLYQNLKFVQLRSALKKSVSKQEIYETLLKLNRSTALKQQHIALRCKAESNKPLSSPASLDEIAVCYNTDFKYTDCNAFRMRDSCPETVDITQ